MNTFGEPTCIFGFDPLCAPPPCPAFRLPTMQIDLLLANTFLLFPVTIVDGDPPGWPGVGSPSRATGLLLTNTVGLPDVTLLAELQVIRSCVARATPGII